MGQTWSCWSRARGGPSDDPKEGRLRLDVRKKFFILRVVRPWPRLPAKLWLPLPGSVQDQVEWGSHQPALGEAVLAHSRRVGLDGL